MKAITNKRVASCLLALADPNDVASLRRLILNHRGVFSERFVLVDFPKVLLPGFAWCLERLKAMAEPNYNMPFSELIAPEVYGNHPISKPPQYSTNGETTYRLDPIRRPSDIGYAHNLTLDTSTCFLDGKVLSPILGAVEQETTLDGGQAEALCESLSRELAFTQGPPGTGKTYLGVSLVKTLLESRDEANRKPILVVCMTNHALDSFLDGLRSAGLTRFARLGRGSKKAWTSAHALIALTRRDQQPGSAKKKWAFAKTQVEGRCFP